MKVLLSVIYISITCGLFGQVNVTFNTTKTASYCQGTPSESDSAQYSPKQTQTTLFVYFVGQKDSARAVTVNSGDTIKLKPGKYIVTFSEILTLKQIEILANPESNSNIAMLSSFYYNKHIITVNRKNYQTFTINYHVYCPWELNPSSPAPGSQRH